MSKKDLEPGRELDALIAEKVMGIKEGQVFQTSKGSYSYKPYPYYSTDIAAAWEVVEKLSAVWSFELETYRDNSIRCFFRQHDHQELCVMQFSNSAPHAICLAALKAISD